LALALPRTNMPWLVNRVSCFIGRVSFSAYLVHFLVVAPFAFYCGPIRVGPWWSIPLFLALLTAVLGVTVWLSALTYRFIERPCIQAGSRFVQRLALSS
jgi:peptidoglycan/LPS O-acetylase OafA/YrhL